MASPSLRTVALKCLERWENETVHADRILADLSKKYQLDSRGHAFVQQIFYGIIRNLTLFIAHLYARPLSSYEKRGCNCLQLPYNEPFI